MKLKTIRIQHFENLTVFRLYCYVMANLSAVVLLLLATAFLLLLIVLISKTILSFENNAYYFSKTIISVSNQKITVP
jgi:hypothetical protein